MRGACKKLWLTDATEVLAFLLLEPLHVRKSPAGQGGLHAVAAHPRAAAAGAASAAA